MAQEPVTCLDHLSQSPDIETGILTPCISFLSLVPAKVSALFIKAGIPTPPSITANGNTAIGFSPLFIEAGIPTIDSRDWEGGTGQVSAL